MDVVKIYNMNNEKEYPFLSDDPIRKEAYGIEIEYGVKKTNHLSLSENVGSDEYEYYPSLDFFTDIKDQKIFCNTNLNSDLPPGSDITRYFSIIRNGVNGSDSRYILRIIPDPGIHSFKVQI